MNVLDVNIFESQRLRLQRWRIHVHQIGKDLGRKNMTDEEIIPLLLQLRHPTFFTRDVDFYHRELCHGRYCLVWLDVKPLEVADYARRLLRHRKYDTHAKRMGTVIRVSPSGLSVWRLRAERVQLVLWNA